MNQKFLIVIVITILLGAVTLLSGAAFNVKIQAEDVEAEKQVQSACESAVFKMNTDKDIVLGTQGERQAIRKAFWNSYCKAKGYLATETGNVNPETGEIPSDGFGLEIDNRAKFEVPCVIYVDRDGYYVEYTRYVKNGSTQESEYKNIMTDKQSFTKDYGTRRVYHVTYTLGKDVTVEVRGGSGPQKISGSYDFCYDELGRPSELSFMGGGSPFMEEHDLCIQQAVSGTVNYSINAHNLMNKQGRKYVFAMPNQSSSFGRMMRNPCVISFTQGKQVAGKNIYGFAGASIEKNRMYYMYLYNFNGKTVKCYTDKGNVEKIKVGTMRELAKDGALPDLD
jgi:hypothetical protein